MLETSSTLASDVEVIRTKDTNIDVHDARALRSEFFREPIKLPEISIDPSVKVQAISSMPSRYVEANWTEETNIDVHDMGALGSLVARVSIELPEIVIVLSGDSPSTSSMLVRDVEDSNVVVGIVDAPNQVEIGIGEKKCLIVVS